VSGQAPRRPGAGRTAPGPAPHAPARAGDPRSPRAWCRSSTTRTPRSPPRSLGRRPCRWPSAGARSRTGLARPRAASRQCAFRRTDGRLSRVARAGRVG